MSRQIPTQSKHQVCWCCWFHVYADADRPPTAHLLAQIYIDPPAASRKLFPVVSCWRTGLVISGSGPSGGTCELPRCQVWLDPMLCPGTATRPHVSRKDLWHHVANPQNQWNDFGINSFREAWAQMATDMHIISIGALPVPCQTSMYTHQFQTT